MADTLIKNARIVNEGEIFESDILITEGLIDKIGKNLTAPGANRIEAKGNFLIPGVIDDQVHFREPGLTHKAEIKTEARAAAAGGITTFMEMPNTVPQSLTHDLLEQKYERAAEVSPVNYSFYMGASNDNLEAVKSVDPKKVCGVKVFMGASTGNMLVDDEEALTGIFKSAPCLVATHCEKEEVVRANLKIYQEKYGEDIPVRMHPEIRSREACIASSTQAIELAKNFGTRLHILHISTADETHLFEKGQPANKRITSEACIHHLWFDDSAYEEKGSFVKWNPAIKSSHDRDEILKAVLDDRIDVIATDHAPHTIEEKRNVYTKTPSGGPLVQHALPAMLEFYSEGKISMENLVRKMCHAVSDCFQIEKRGYIREGYYADLVLLEEKTWEVNKQNIMYKCGWSPFEGQKFRWTVKRTLVNGETVWLDGRLNESVRGKRLSFDRD